MGTDNQSELFDFAPEPKPDARVSFEPAEFAVEEPPVEPTQDAEQPALLNLPEWWEEHWNGMPEYISEDLTPFKSIYVHFEDREAMEAFAKLVGQTVTLDTKMIWYPEAEIGRFADKRYIQKAPVLYPDRQKPE